MTQEKKTCKICKGEFRKSPFIICDDCIELENALIKVLNKKTSNWDKLNKILIKLRNL